jgi:hypothetical protein
MRYLGYVIVFGGRTIKTIDYRHHLVARFRARNVFGTKGIEEMISSFGFKPADARY